MTRPKPPAARKPTGDSPQARATQARATQARATQVFRAFVRQLERLDTRAAKKDAAR
jgi:hypothetical protein